MKAARLGLVDEPAALLEIDREGLFREDMLAGAQRRERDAEMGGRHGEVDHEIDVVAGQELIDRQRLDAVAACLSLRDLGPHVGAGPQRQAAIGGNVLEVDAGNVAASDDADVEGSS